MSLVLQRSTFSLLGRGLVRLPLDHFQQMGLRAGDVVAVRGARTTHARVLPGPKGTEALEASEDMARNLGVDWGSKIGVSKADLPKLASIILKIKGPRSTAEAVESLYDLALTEGDVLGPFADEVLALTPAKAGLFTDTTTLTIQAEPPAGDYDDIGGLSDQIARVHEMVATPLLRPDLFVRLGVPAPRGVLFTGPPGSGKTLLARNIAARTSAAFFHLNGPEIVSKHYGESEAALRSIFDAAGQQAPSIIFIDEIDAIAPRREGLSGEKQLERRVVAQLLTLMDGLSERGRVIVMAATNLPDSLDPALRRPGRFDREISFGPPNPKQRKQILDIHLRNAPLSADVDLGQIADEAYGYVGADLAALAREASLAALDRAVQAAGGEANLRTTDLFITQPDLRKGLTATAPSALRDTQVESPAVSFDEVGGMAAEKRALTEAVIWPQRHKANFAALNLRPAAGVLLSGPPGSGKTLLARALAFETGMNFIPVRPPRIMSAFLGEAERNIADLFTKARHAAPSLIFLDELDALAPRRSGKDPALDRVVSQLLTEMDGLASNSGIVVMAATNRPAAIDPALMRPGRFDVVVPFGLPDRETRLAILRVHCRNLPLTDILAEVAEATEGVSAAALAAMVTTAARAALRRAIDAGLPEPQITRADFWDAMGLHAQSQRALQQDHIVQRAENERI